ncbi:MAG: thymidine phosphorylase [Clostridia bacterium]
MRIYDIIKKKRDGGELSTDEINFFVEGYTKDEIPDEQIAALLMAIYFQKMTVRETYDLTYAIVNSGEVIDLSQISGIKVDKHSTGGVGDKTSIIVAPMVASCGVKVAKMSGRGLGHTGGTVDKLMSIQGYQTSISREKFFDIVNTVGVSIIGQSGNLAPADKKLYALRDVTATIENTSLIAASIMGKKLASGADKILLDVKVGSGSFNKTIAQAEELAKLMVQLGKSAKKDTVALLTNMDIPLGTAIGNSLEVKECIDVLQGRGADDLTEICIELASNMLYLGGLGNMCECMRKAKESISSGRAYETLIKMVKAHGGNESWIKTPDLFPKAPLTKTVNSVCEGYITAIDAEQYGLASLCLGAGRNKKEDNIDYSAGIILNKKLGDYVNQGDVIATLFTTFGNLDEATNIVLNATTFGRAKPMLKPLVLGRFE